MSLFMEWSLEKECFSFVIVIRYGIIRSYIINTETENQT